MKLLALDCSTEACSVALYENTDNGVVSAGRVIVEDHQLASREHTQRLLPMVEHVLALSQTRLSQLDAIAFGRGPGSFTGLRIALGAVQGLAYGADLPVLPVSTLAAVAQTAVEARVQESGAPTNIIAAIDARMDEVYWASYYLQDGLVTAFAEEHLSAPEAMQLECNINPALTLGAGSGWVYADRIALASELKELDEECQPRAGAVARLADRELRAGRACSADRALPVYLRDEVAWQKTAPAM